MKKKFSNPLHLTNRFDYIIFLMEEVSMIVTSFQFFIQKFNFLQALFHKITIKILFFKDLIV